MRYFVTVEDRTLEVELGPGKVSVDGEAVAADFRRVPGTDVRSLLLNGASHAVVARRDGRGSWSLHVGGRECLAHVVDERTRAIREMTGEGSGPVGPRPVRAPMPGLVVKVEVEPGQTVDVGQGLLIVEAMKMENELRAEAPGRVRTVAVVPGQAVEKGQILIEFEAPDALDKETAP